MTAGFSRFAAVFFLLGLASQVGAATLSLVDDAGRRVTMNAPATRIVALSPHVTELVYAAGAGSRLVGVSSYSNYPAEAKKLPQVGDSGKADAERVLALQPDLVIGWHSGNSAADLATLERLGIPVYLTEPRRLADIPRLIETIGRLAGSQPEAARVAAGFRAGVASLKRNYGNRRPVSVFYEIWHKPLLTINGEHLISDVITLCGGRNIFAGAASLTPAVAAESVLAANPEAILASGSLQGWQRFPQLRAVQGGHLFRIDPDLLHRQTPRILAGAKRVCEQIEQVRQRH
jgi:iron complex transport system substrate-binding protein